MIDSETVWLLVGRFIRDSSGTINNGSSNKELMLVWLGFFNLKNTHIKAPPTLLIIKNKGIAIAMQIVPSISSIAVPITKDKVGKYPANKQRKKVLLFGSAQK